MAIKIKQLNIAVEAFTLSDDHLTGIGRVVLHYLENLKIIDKDNNYFIYTSDDLKYLKLDNPRWRHLTFNYFIKDMRGKSRKSWLALKERRRKEKTYTLKLKIIILRIIKIFFELTDRVYYSKKLAGSLRKNNIDVYIGTSTSFYPLFFDSSLRKVSIVYDLVWKYFPGTMDTGNKIVMNLFAKRYLRNADLLIAISENTRKDFCGYLGKSDNIYAIPIAADNNIYYRADKSSIKKVLKKYNISTEYILSVCTLEPRKNLETLLHAYSRFKNRKDVKLVLAGKIGWIESEFFNVSRELGIEKDIFIIGYVPDQDLAPLYSGASVFAFPSLYEGFGLPVLEAMQCGCPVVTSTSSSIPEIVGNAGIMVEPKDAEGLYKALEKVIKDKKLRNEMIKKGVARAKLFSWEKSAERLLGKIIL